MGKSFKKAIVFAITASFAFNSGLAQILSYAETTEINKNEKAITSNSEDTGNDAIISNSEDTSNDAITSNSNGTDNDTISNSEDTDNYDSTDSESLTFNNFTYEVYDSEVAIMGYTGEDTEIIIPSEIDGMKVTIIGYDAFNGCSALKSITIPEGVTTIGMSAFSGCSALESITIPEGVTTIGNAAFSGCSTLESITIPEGVTAIKDSVFSGCSALNNITIPESVTDIESCAFFDCSALEGVTIPEGVISIYELAFYGCTNLKGIDMPNSIKEIEGNSFYNCPNLKMYVYKGSVSEKYAIENNIPYKYMDPEDATFGDFIYYELNNSEVAISGYTGEDTEITIPSEIDGKKVTCIGYDAFTGCSSLESITIPEGVTYIRDFAFYGCDALKSIIIPGSVTDIGRYAFCECSSLESIIIPEGVTTISEVTFCDCPNLKELYMPNSIEEINYATIQDVPPFYNCPNLTMYVYKGSLSEKYAIDNGMTYEYRDKEDVNIRTITFDADNGTENIVKTVGKDEQLDYTPEDPTKDGYTFVGWFKDTDDTTTKYKSGAAYTEDVTYTAKWAHVDMLGAQVRAVVSTSSVSKAKAKAAVDQESGIRFGTKIYNDGDEIVEKGTIIIPARLVPDGESLTLDTPKIARSVAKVNYEVNESENYITYLGTLVGIPSAQFDTEITASAYVIYKDKAGNKYTVYSPYKNGSTTVNTLLNS